MNNITDLSFRSTLGSPPNDCACTVDFVEAGAGPLVVLVHSSMAGARQWSPLIREMEAFNGQGGQSLRLRQHAGMVGCNLAVA